MPPLVLLIKQRVQLISFKETRQKMNKSGGMPSS